MTRQGLRVVAISVDPPQKLEEMRESAGVSFVFLSDPEGGLLDFFGIRHEKGGMDGSDLAQSASFLLDSGGRVTWTKIAENYRVRPRPSEILAAAEGLPDVPTAP